MIFRFSVYILSIILACAVPSFAQLAQNVSTERFFEYSMDSLDETANALEEQNRQLTEYIRQYRWEIDGLRQKYQGLAGEAQSLSKSTKQVNEEFNVANQRISAATREFFGLKDDSMQVNKEYGRLEKSLQEKRKDNEKIDESMQQLRKDIVRLSDKLEDLDSSLETSYREEKSKINRAISESQKNVGWKEKKLMSLKKQYGKPLVMAEELAKKQVLLKQKLTALEEKLADQVSQGGRLQEEIERINLDSQSQTKELDSSLEGLETKRTGLENILAKAGQKLRDKKTPLEVSHEEIEQLEKGLDVIEKENQELKDEYNRLMAKLEGINSGGRN